MNATIIQQQSRPAIQIPAQPVMRTIGRADMPAANVATGQRGATGSQSPSPSTAPVGWNGACWHDGAD